MNKKELQGECNERGIEFDVDATNKTLEDLIFDFDLAKEETAEDADVLDEEVEIDSRKSISLKEFAVESKNGFTTIKNIKSGAKEVHPSKRAEELFNITE